MHLVELAPYVRPAGRKLDMASGREPFEARVAVDLDDALEVLQMSR